MVLIGGSTLGAIVNNAKNVVQSKMATAHFGASLQCRGGNSRSISVSGNNFEWCVINAIIYKCERDNKRKNHKKISVVQLQGL